MKEAFAKPIILRKTGELFWAWILITLLIDLNYLINFRIMSCNNIPYYIWLGTGFACGSKLKLQWSVIVKFLYK